MGSTPIEQTMQRVVVWFSCGAASAAAAKLAVDKYGKDRVVVVYCDTSASEHPDNLRFLADVEQWLGIKVVRLSSIDYTTIDDVFEKTKYMAGIQGARCTLELKKKPRQAFQDLDDVHVFGFTADETKRIADFEQRNPELKLEWILRDAGYDKQDCYTLLMNAGIALPMMYLLGYRNNNCPGCVKATSPAYWAKVRRDFPEVFARRAKQSKLLNVRLTRYKGKRIFLDELPPDSEIDLTRYKEEHISCGPECGSSR